MVAQVLEKEVQESETKWDDLVKYDLLSSSTGDDDEDDDETQLTLVTKTFQRVRTYVCA